MGVNLVPTPEDCADSPQFGITCLLKDTHVEIHICTACAFAFISGEDMGDMFTKPLEIRALVAALMYNLLRNRIENNNNEKLHITRH